MLGLLGVALVVAGACGSPPAPPTSAPVLPSLQPPKHVWAKTTPCRYGLGAAELPVVEDERYIGFPAAAYARGKLLVAYQRAALEIDARIFDASRNVSRKIEVSPRGGSHVRAQVVGAGDRFFVAWNEQERRWAGRYVDRDGGLGPIKSLPGSPMSELRLRRVRDRFLATWTEDVSRDGARACILQSQELDAELAPVGPRPPSPSARAVTARTPRPS